MTSRWKPINELFDRTVIRQRDPIFARASESGFLKHADGAEIVARDVCDQRTGGFKSEQQRDSSGGDALAPKFPTEPIADQALAGPGIRPRANVSSDAIANEDGAARGSGIAENVGR